MDYFAHGIWSYIIFHKTKKPLYAVLAGLVPDTFSWGIYLLYMIFTGRFEMGAPNLIAIPDWVFTLYGISHSLIVWGFVIFVVYLLFRKWVLYLFAGPIMILFDLLTHTREFLPTPFLWPLSSWAFPGISWGNGWFMLVNWVIIILSLAYIIGKKRLNKASRKKKKQ